jgi:hypothetical protein
MDIENARPANPANPGRTMALDTDSFVETEMLVSFLLNALYLFGDPIIAVPGAPAPIAAELARLGHRVSPTLPQGEARAKGAGGGEPPGRKASARKFDRVFLGGILGREADPAGQLRALRAALRPGGLLAFQVLDRDRAWERTGPGASPADGGEDRMGIDFDPASGKLIAWTAETAEGKPAPRRATASVQTWNLGELKGLLRGAGLELERAYGDWDGSAPGTGSGRLLVVAARPRIRRHPRRKSRYSPSSASVSDSASAPTSSGSSSASKEETLATRSWGEKGFARNSAKASPTSSTTLSVAP